MAGQAALATTVHAAPAGQQAAAEITEEAEPQEGKDQEAEAMVLAAEVATIAEDLTVGQEAATAAPAHLAALAAIMAPAEAPAAQEATAAAAAQ